MIKQIQAIIWKEWREFFFQQSIKDKLQTVILITVIGIILPVNKGAGWFDTPFFYGVAVMGPILMVVTVVCDLFVGERERHTLETLLASRLSAKGIVIGKVLFAVSYATCITILLLVLNVIAINVAYYKSSFIMFSFKFACMLACINFFMAFLTALLGVVISIGAKTVKQGQLTLTISLLTIILLSSFLIGKLPHDFKNALMHYYASLSNTEVFLLAGLLLVIIDLAIFKIVIIRFKKIAYNL